MKKIFINSFFAATAMLFIAFAADAQVKINSAGQKGAVFKVLPSQY